MRYISETYYMWVQLVYGANWLAKPTNGLLDFA